MITEDYVGFETAKLLKEKGFKEGTYHCYTTKGVLWFEDVLFNHNDGTDYSAPTLQMAMKWLREAYGINISVNPCQEDPAHFYEFHVYIEGVEEGSQGKWLYSEYEQACEAAIKYCLENLV